MVGDEFEAAQNQPQRSFDAWPEIMAATKPLDVLDAQIPPLRGRDGAPHEVVLPRHRISAETVVHIAASGDSPTI
jgi:hypothetical protein